MPAKLQVDESFAFLFCCIEASGCKIDFKLVGEATDLQPAAARMRYSRLKRAVENGDFRGSILTRGPVHSNPQLAALANPDSLRLAEEASGAQQTPRQPLSNVTTFFDDAKAGFLTGGHGNEVVLDNDDEDEEEEEEEVIETLEGSNLADQQRKRRATTEVHHDSDSQNLFYPDTSNASRSAKYMKREDNDDDTEEVEDDDEDEDATYTPENPSQRRARQQTRRGGRKLARKSTSARRTAVPISKNPPANNNTRGRADHTPHAESFEDFEQNALRTYSANYNRHAAVHNQQPFGNNATRTSHSVGIVSGQPRPTQEDISFAQATGQAPMRQIGQPSSRVNTPSMLRHGHIQANSSPVIDSPMNYRPQISQTHVPRQFQRYQPNNRLNPASILDDVEAPRPSRFTVQPPARKPNIYTTAMARTGANLPMPQNNVIISTGAGAIDPALRSVAPSPSPRPFSPRPAWPLQANTFSPANFNPHFNGQRSENPCQGLPIDPSPRVRNLSPQFGPLGITSSPHIPVNSETSEDAQAAETLNAMAQGESAESDRGAATESSVQLQGR